MDNAIYNKIFITGYTVSDFLDEFKIEFPVFIPILAEDLTTDVTDEVLAFYLNVAVSNLPEGIASYFKRDRLILVLKYMIAHLLAYAGILKNTNGLKLISLLRKANSKSADGLSISYSDLANAQNQKMPILMEFLMTTFYGMEVAKHIEKTNGTVGVYAV